MGDRLGGQRARQHSDLTGSALRAAVLALLAVDGVISAVLGAAFLQMRIGVVPFPISALLSGVLNAALVWAGLQWTSSGRLAALPVWAWLLTVAVMMFGGPGGDVAWGGPGFDEWSPVVLLVLGAVPPGIVLSRRLR